MRVHSSLARLQQPLTEVKPRQRKIDEMTTNYAYKKDLHSVVVVSGRSEFIVCRAHVKRLLRKVMKEGRPPEEVEVKSYKMASLHYVGGESG